MKSQLQFYDKEDRPWPAMRLTSAAIVGHTTPTTVRLWVRVHQPGNYALLLSETPIETWKQPNLRPDGQVELTFPNLPAQVLNARVFPQQFTFKTDNTAVFDIAELTPGTRYYYAVFALAERPERWEIARDEPHRFKTAGRNPESVRFGFFSCHMPFKGRSVQNLDMWESFGQLLRDFEADFVIGGGDQVYTDGDKRVSIWRWLQKNKHELLRLSERDRREVMVSWYRDIYRGYWGDLALRRVFRGYPTYMIWDDHEIMDGWGSYTQKELSNTLDSIWEWENRDANLALAHGMFAAAAQVYGEYQHAHNPKTRKAQWDFTFEWSHLAFFILDMRGHRNYERPKNKILGKKQGRRFLDWLNGPQAKDASAIVIVSPVPVVHLKNFVANYLDLPALGLADDLRDEWEHESNYEERNKILDAIFDFSADTNKPILILSGDVHIGAAFKLTRKGKSGAQVFQLTSSGITYAKAPGKLLRLVVRNRGELAGLPKSKRTSLERLHVFEDNNFAFVHSHKRADGSVALAWDLYGTTGREEEVVRLKRLQLT